MTTETEASDAAAPLLSELIVRGMKPADAFAVVDRYRIGVLQGSSPGTEPDPQCEAFITGDVGDYLCELSAGHEGEHAVVIRWKEHPEPPGTCDDQACYCGGTPT